MNEYPKNEKLSNLWAEISTLYGLAVTARDDVAYSAISRCYDLVMEIDEVAQMSRLNDESLIPMTVGDRTELTISGIAVERNNTGIWPNHMTLRITNNDGIKYGRYTFKGVDTEPED